MFKKTIASREGRLVPWASVSRTSARKRFGRSSPRYLAFAFFCVLTVVYILGPGSGRWDGKRHGDASKYAPGGIHVGSMRNAEILKAASQAPLEDGNKNSVHGNKIPLSNQSPARPQGTDMLPSSEEYPSPSYNPHWTKHTHPPGPPTPPSISSERPSFDEALQKVISMLPDEVYRREFLRPVEAGVAERMREMGFRTRAYRSYFEAWEILHLGEDAAGNMFVRDDIIQYLRARESLPSLAYTASGEQGQESRDIGSSSGGVVENDEILLKSQQLSRTIQSYEAFRSFITDFANLLFPWTAPYFANHMTLHTHLKNGGRGIVLTAGENQAPWLLTTIYSFRQLGCTLPIEVMYLGESDLGEDHRSDLEALPGVTTRDISAMVNDEGWELAGWAAKPFAILLSSFREVIFIDADSLFFRDPAALFEDPEYRRTGALFFRDRVFQPGSKKDFLKQIMPRPVPRLAKQSPWWTGESTHVQESGVVVVDKWRHFMALLLVCRFNGSDRDKRNDIDGVYDLMYGDKETFWIGFLLSGDESFAFHGGATGTMGIVEPPKEETEDDDEGEEEVRKKGKEERGKATICAPQLLHFGLDGRPLWFNGWLLKNKYAGRAAQRFASVESFIMEPRLPREEGEGEDWELLDANVVCLTAEVERLGKLTEEERGVFDMMVRRTREVAGYEIGED
ncbi:glycosyltransferase family 71 protein [Biscogniauxia mediterranea]|nr:glycosyltransferase family 71 protein [Biscogniauxia mediterranea]